MKTNSISRQILYLSKIFVFVTILCTTAVTSQNVLARETHNDRTGDPQTGEVAIFYSCDDYHMWDDDEHPYFTDTLQSDRTGHGGRGTVTYPDGRNYFECADYTNLRIVFDGGNGKCGVGCGIIYEDNTYDVLFCTTYGSLINNPSGKVNVSSPSTYTLSQGVLTINYKLKKTSGKFAITYNTGSATTDGETNSSTLWVYGKKHSHSYSLTDVESLKN